MAGVPLLFLQRTVLILEHPSTGSKTAKKDLDLLKQGVTTEVGFSEAGDECVSMRTCVCLCVRVGVRFGPCGEHGVATEM